jgi:hypothetical protein
MRRSPGVVTRLAAARRSVVALALALLLAGCFGNETPAEQAAAEARLLASMQGLTVARVSCSPSGEVAWTCTGRLRSGREFTCSVGPLGREGLIGTCTAQARRP